MDVTFVLRGLVIGFSIAAPVGPIGVLCIRRTLIECRTSGFISGLGAATADAAYGCIAGLGLTFFSNILITHQTWVRFIGGLFLCYLGVKTFLAKQPVERVASYKGSDLIGAFTSTFFLTLTNPMTILSFSAIFAGLGLASTNGSYGSAAALVFGVFIGSSMWWLILCCSVGVLRERFDPRGLQWVNIISGAIITSFGFFSLLSLT
jgi:threonine/homoserine/homoserine lactone efflux protein